MALYPPAHVCAALYKFDPSLRLCWVNHPNEEWEDGSRGCFGVIRLMPSRRTGPPEAPRINRPHWELVHGAGSIFDRRGGCSVDWDFGLQPVLDFSLTPVRGFYTADVYSGKFMYEMRRRWVTGKEADRILARGLLAKGKAVESRHQDRVEEITDRWCSASNKTGESSPVMTYEDAKNDLTPDFIAAKEGRYSFDKMFVKQAGLEGALDD